MSYAGTALGWPEAIRTITPLIQSRPDLNARLPFLEDIPNNADFINHLSPEFRNDPASFLRLNDSEKIEQLLRAVQRTGAELDQEAASLLARFEANTAGSDDAVRLSAVAARFYYLSPKIGARVLERIEKMRSAKASRTEACALRTAEALSQKITPGSSSPAGARNYAPPLASPEITQERLSRTPQPAPSESGPFAAELHELGRLAAAERGEADVALINRLKRTSLIAEMGGRFLLLIPTGIIGWLFGAAFLALHFSLEAQMNHSIMHGAYINLPGAGRFVPEQYETLAIPFQSKTWRDAHRIHHANPSLLELDPDTIHPLIRVHADQRWRLWHLFNTFLGGIFVFEVWAYDYDHFLKKEGLRPSNDHGEIVKFFSYLGYQYLLFAALSAILSLFLPGMRWTWMLWGTLVASIIRNFVFMALQSGSSVGSEVSTEHYKDVIARGRDPWYRFQVETSKNFAIRNIFKNYFGGLDRHIEHHLYPYLPPNRLHSLSARIQELCRMYGVKYREYPSLLASLRDSLGYLGKLSVPDRNSK